MNPLLQRQREHHGLQAQPTNIDSSMAVSRTLVPKPLFAAGTRPNTVKFTPSTY